MSRIALELGPLKIYWYSLFIFLGLLAGIITAIREAKNIILVKILFMI